MEYQASIKYLESFWKFGIKLGLGRMEHLLSVLGDPHKKFKSIHVAGTNGKGSVCAMTASVLKEAGYKTGLYTSPHLVDYTERIKINGRDISKKKFAGLIRDVRSAIRTKYVKKELPTEFEILTAAAFLCFAREKVDIAVIETGLGGRLDSTNVVYPEVCAITNIALDHCNILGHTIKAIAAEKAGIIKKNVPLVTAVSKGPAYDVIKKICAGNNAALIKAGASDVKRLPVPFSGEHQKENAAVCLGIISVLKSKGFKISSSSVRRGLKNAKWPARFQVIGKDPVVVIDGAHNPSGMEALSRELKRIKKNKLYVVLGVLRDKDYKKMCRTISSVSDRFFLTAPSHTRACPSGVLAADIKKHHVPFEVSKSPSEGLDRALKSCGRGDIVCVCGSLFTCGEVLRSRHLTGSNVIV